MRDGSRAARTILVIDDNEVVLEMTSFTLESAGFRVLTCDSAQAAIRCMLHERPDLVLLDVNMPSSSGESIAEILTRAAPARGMLVVLFSSLPPNVLRMKALATGAHGFIQKTRMQADLIRQVKGFLEQAESRGARSLREDGGASSARIVAAERASERIALDPPSSGMHAYGASVESRPSGSMSVYGPSPESRPTSASAPPPRHESGTVRIAKPSTLFVDDDVTILTAYRRAFSSEEWGGEFVASAEQAALRLALPDPPDVVVTDLVLPGVNGIELYRRAIEYDPSFRHRFVFVTGAASLSYVADFLSTVGGRALEKPCDIYRLRDAIRYSATGARILKKQSEG